MIYNRLGCDLILEWPITIDGETTPLDELDLKLYIICNRFKKEMTFTVEDNTLVFTFFGRDQKVCGDYSLELVLNKGKVGQAILDNKNAFNIYK